MTMQIPLVWLYFAAGVGTGVLAAALAAWWLAAAKRRAWEEAAASLEARLEACGREAREAEEAFRREIRELEAAWERSRIENAGLTARVEGLVAEQERARVLARRLEETMEEKARCEKRLAETEAKAREERRGFEARLDELKEAREAMQKEFKSLAAQIMEENGRRFGQLSKEGVEAVLAPLRREMGEFKQRIEQVHTEEVKGVAALMNEIGNLKALNQRISEEALRLTRALRGETKTQGIWGEMVLERVLEASGLREGEEYEREVSLEDGDHRRYRPDVVVHLPDDRDIVIDAKTSLVAYEKYVNAEEGEEKERYAREHLAAVRAHIERLADKRYTRLEGIETLDFLFMFMPIEGALMLALERDTGLYDEAFRKGIVLVSPTTLLVALRAVENTWRHDRQNRNALLIAKKAGDLYDKFVAFGEEFLKIGRQIETLQKSYDGAWGKLTAGRGNLVRRIEELRELGAKASKEMPRKVAEESEASQLPSGDSSARSASST
ncbi:DNA recombination protein RmuC [Hydrogenimonas sp.]